MGYGADMSDNSVAVEILRQIDAIDPWARARWGAKRMAYSDDSLSIAVSRATIHVRLEPSDTYTVEMYRGGRKVRATDDVYCDALVDAIDGVLGWRK